MHTWASFKAWRVDLAAGNMAESGPTAYRKTRGSVAESGESGVARAMTRGDAGMGDGEGQVLLLEKK
jgi:hypothetical protein